jgi:hypothetical protein
MNGNRLNYAVISLLFELGGGEEVFEPSLDRVVFNYGFWDGLEGVLEEAKI